MRRFANLMVRIFSDILIRVRPLLVFLERSVNCARGFAYGSYSLAEEASLAVSMLPSREGVIIDGGANAGHWSHSVLDLAREGRISVLLMIEPNESHARSHQALHQTFKGVVSTEWVALGSEPAVKELHFDTDYSGLASLYDRDIAHHGISLGKTKPVRVERLTDIISRHQIERIDFLKLDLEGHELEAFKGAEPLLASQAVRAIQFEFGGANIDSRTYFRDFWELLHTQYGYSLYRLLPGRRLMTLTRYSENLERFAWQNLLACSPGVKPKWPCR